MVRTRRYSSPVAMQDIKHLMSSAYLVSKSSHFSYQLLQKHLQLASKRTSTHHITSQDRYVAHQFITSRHLPLVVRLEFSKAVSNEASP